MATSSVYPLGTQGGGSLPGDPQIIHFPAVVPTTMSAFYHYEGGSLHEHSSHILTSVIGRTYESHTGLKY